MVRATEHTCKDCNKIYASYQSLCNHRSKFHAVLNNIIKQHETALNNIHSEFNCRKCNNRMRNHYRPKLIENFQDIIEDNIEKFLHEYEQKLNASNYKFKHKYIFIDEYQDINEKISTLLVRYKYF